jgi:hypothetical protein
MCSLERKLCLDSVLSLIIWSLINSSQGFLCILSRYLGSHGCINAYFFGSGPLTCCLVPDVKCNSSSNVAYKVLSKKSSWKNQLVSKNKKAMSFILHVTFLFSPSWSEDFCQTIVNKGRVLSIGHFHSQGSANFFVSPEPDVRVYGPCGFC